MDLTTGAAGDCRAHGGVCGKVESIEADVDRQQRWIGDLQAEYRGHANGDHFKRREHDDFMRQHTEDIRAMTEAQGRLLTRLEDSEKCLHDHVEGQGLADAKGTRKVAVAQLVVNGLVSITVGALGVLGTYLLLLAKIGGAH